MIVPTWSIHFEVSTGLRCDRFPGMNIAPGYRGPALASASLGRSTGPVGRSHDCPGPTVLSGSSATVAVAPVPVVPSVARVIAPVPSVPSVALQAIASVPGSSRMIGVPVPLALIAASHRGSTAGSGRGTSRSCVPAWLSLQELDCVRVLTPVAARTETSSALLSRPRLPALASGEVVALVLVRFKATVLDDLASGPPWLMVLDCVGVVGPAAAISETSSSLGVPARSLSIASAPVEDIDPLAALTKAAPLAANELEVLSVALWAIAPVPLFIAAAGRSPEEFGRSCLVRTGEVVSARRALLLSRYPRV